MKIKDYKCKCGHNDFFFADKGNQKGIYCSYCGKWVKWADKDEQNLTMKQEPCGDAISKQAVFVAMRNNYRCGGRDIDGDYVEGNYSEKLYDAIMSLPPVNQQPKTGCWEKTTDRYSYWYRCSCCGEKVPKDSWGNDYFSPYCPECGVPMVESEEHS